MKVLFSLLLILQLLLAVVSVHAQIPNPTPPPHTIAINSCAPSQGITESECHRLIHLCWTQWQLQMKWTGPGSPHIHHRSQGDGGCQCAQYCGYHTEEPCNRDHRCIWVESRNACYHRNPLYKGMPFPECTRLTNDPPPAPGRLLRGQEDQIEEVDVPGLDEIPESGIV